MKVTNSSLNPVLGLELAFLAKATDGKIESVELLLLLSLCPFQDPADHRKGKDLAKEIGYSEQHSPRTRFRWLLRRLVSIHEHLPFLRIFSAPAIFIVSCNTCRELFLNDPKQNGECQRVRLYILAEASAGGTRRRMEDKTSKLFRW